MPAVQTSYTTAMRVAFAGQKADMIPATIVSRIVQTAALPFGAAASQGTGDSQVIPAAGTAVFVGIAIQDNAALGNQSTAPTTVDAYQVGDLAAIMTRGTVWVTTSEAVTAGAPAYVTLTTGALHDTVGTNPRVGTWRTSAASGALAILEVQV
jgi:hypothetical protein